MSYVKCAYFKCQNTSRNISLFRFPIQDSNRLVLWIQNSGNVLLQSLTTGELKNRYLCAAHFKPSSVHRGYARSRLLGPAIPTPFVEEASTSASAQDTGNADIARLHTKVLRNRYLCIEHFDSKYVRTTAGKRSRLSPLAFLEDYLGRDDDTSDVVTSTPSADAPHNRTPSWKLLVPTKRYARVRPPIDLAAADGAAAPAAGATSAEPRPRPPGADSPSGPAATLWTEEDLFLGCTAERRVKPEPADVRACRACRACLATGGRLYDMRQNGLEDTFVVLSGQLLCARDGWPRALCAACCAQLAKFAQFRERCHRAQDLLGALTTQGTLTTEDITAIDRNYHELTPNLTQNTIFLLDCNKYEYPKPFIAENDEAMNIKREFDERETTENSLDEGDANEISEVSTHAETTSPTETTTATESTEATTTESTETTTPESTENITFESTKATTKESTKTTTATKSTNPTKRQYSTKTTKATKRNVTSSKRKTPDDDLNFNVEAFERRYNVKVTRLSVEQQKEVIENRKKTVSYLKSKHRCELCGKGFSIEDRLKNHMACHDPSVGPLECEICHRRFRRRCEESKHRYMHLFRITCRTCGLVMMMKISAQRHFETHQGRTYVCRHCPRAFRTETGCLTHARLAHPARGVACALCGETFLSRAGVRLHAALAHRPRLLPKCEVCHAEFSTSEALERHKSSVGEDAHFGHEACRECGAAVGRDGPAAHAQHCRPPYRCDECDECFSGAASFARHSRRKHAPRRARAPAEPHGSLCCHLCGKMLSSQSVLALHLLRHAAPRGFPCELCDKAFHTNRQRKDHATMHTGEKPYECAQCPLRFRSGSSLWRHRQVVHLGRRKRAPCFICGKMFATIWAARLHARAVHAGLPPPRRRRPRKQVE